MMVKGLMTQLPVYVTRADSDGLTASYSLSVWMVLLAMMLAWANVVGWGIYGLVELALKVI